MSVSRESKRGLGRHLADALLIRILNVLPCESQQLLETTCRVEASWVTLTFPLLPDVCKSQADLQWTGNDSDLDNN